MKVGEKSRAYVRERYAWLKEHGVCVDCAERDAFNGFVRCPECLEKHQLHAYKYNHSERRKVLRKARIQRRMEQGLCVNCSNPIYEGSKRYCKRCHERQKIASKLAQQSLRANRREKTLDEIEAEKRERGKRNIIIARQSPKWRLNIDNIREELFKRATISRQSLCRNESAAASVNAGVNA